MTGGDYSAMSKLGLAKECGRLAELLAQAKAAAEAVPVQQAPDRVPEADALARCVRAIDALPHVRDTTYNYGGSLHPDQATIGRLLRTLADKYSVPLVETTVEVRDCQRAHIDQVDSMALMAALGNSVVPR